MSTWLCHFSTKASSSILLLASTTSEMMASPLCLPWPLAYGATCMLLGMLRL